MAFANDFTIMSVYVGGVKVASYSNLSPLIVDELAEP